MNRPQSPVKGEAEGSDKGIDDKRTISVRSSGEVTSLPDVIQFMVIVKSCKDTMEDAQASVKRRTDYIAQVVRKNGVKDGMTSSTDLNKITTEQGEQVTMCTEVEIKCDTFLKCETIRNLLVEKLDSSVQFSPISFFHTTEAKQVGR